jgi:hydrogenase maturation protease
MVRIGVIGIGNDARGDDAVGLEVARRLRHDAPAGVDIEEIRGEGLSLLDHFKGRDAIIVIDASYSGAAPGSIHRLEPRMQPIPKELYLCSTHAFGVGEAIELARSLQQLPPQLVIYGIEGMHFDVGSEMSADVRRVVPEVIQRVQQDIATFQAQATGDEDRA